MKNLSLTFCLVIASLLASVGSGFAGSHLPKCVGSPSNDYDERLTWYNCIGKIVYLDENDYFLGEYKNGLPNGQGVFVLSGKVITEGIWKNDEFQYAQKTPYSPKTAKPSILRNAFIKLSKTQRKQLQSNLKDLGFYKSSIDGLYGKGTAGALTAYNKQNLNGADLKKSENVEKLFNVVLELKPAPKSNEIISASDLPKCKNSPANTLEKIKGWSQCFGTLDDLGFRYIGEWRFGHPHGNGVITYPNGDKYSGEWYHDKTKHGKGTFISANGNKYIGDFKNGEKHGQGTYRWSNGDEYVGEFKDGKWNGQGIYTFKNGEKYIGGFKDNRKYGQGTFTYINGDKYVGEYIDDKWNGQGTYTYGPKSGWAGDKYVGEYSNGKRHGQGTYTFADGTVEEGIWKDDGFQHAQKLSPPVPIVKAPTQDDDTYKVASGTGFYVSDQGHIITNHHVIEGCKDMKVHSKGNVLETTKISEDKRNDLALLKTSQTPKHSFALSTESPFPLQEIIVAGYPFGEKVSSTLKFTQGIVSSIAGLGNDYSQIQIDAAIQPGNSGGPILDEYGNVVAVAVAKLSLKKILKDYGVVPENTNFGVKSSAVRNLMEGNGVSFKSPNTEVISKRELSQIATDGTVYLTCWMTTAQIEQMRARKVLFEDLE